MTTTNTTPTAATPETKKAEKTPLEVATKTATTYHESAALAHDAAASALRQLGDEDSAADALAHEEQAKKHRARLAVLTGVAAEQQAKTPRQLADEAEDKAGAATRRATLADRALRDLAVEAANPNDLPLTGGSTTTPEQAEVAAKVEEAKAPEAPAKRTK